MEDFLVSVPISWMGTHYWVQVLCGFWNSNSGSQSCIGRTLPNPPGQGSLGCPRPNFVVQAGLKLRVHLPLPPECLDSITRPALFYFLIFFFLKRGSHATQAALEVHVQPRMTSSPFKIHFKIFHLYWGRLKKRKRDEVK